jgi:hypothetical protein
MAYAAAVGGKRGAGTADPHAGIAQIAERDAAHALEAFRTAFGAKGADDDGE